MSKKLSYCLVLLFIIFSGINTLNAQRLTISGTVASASDKSVIPGAVISVKNTNIGTTTNIDGHFKLVVKKMTRSFVSH